MKEDRLRNMKYHFHARASGIPLFISESIFHPEGYGMFDYYFLQEKTLLSGYFSDFGIQQMRDYARMNLFDPARRRDIIKAIRAYDERLKNFTLPENYWSTHLDMRNRLAKFATMKALAKEFGSQYFIMEQPWLFPLEEIVQKACDREGLTLEVVLRDSKIIRNFSKEGETLLKTLVELGHLKLSVHAHVEPLMQATHQLFTFISRKEDIPMEIVQSMVSDDIEEYFRTGIVALDELELRSQGVVLLPSGIDGAPKMGVGAEYEKWCSNLEARFDGDIKGVVACRGKVRGRVTLHLDWINVTEVPKGNILVTGMTNPQMIPYIKNVAGIVTDEGGLMCHAAIISREMKKPCIIGTKIVTQVLHDGDLVEVDADRGIVTILERGSEHG